MGELSLLRELRSDVVPPAETRERSRRALEAAIRGRRRRPRLLLVAAVAGVLLGAGAAYALATQFLVGDPAPRAVKDQTAMLNVVKGELIARLGAGLGISAEETRLAATIDASTDLSTCGWRRRPSANTACFRSSAPSFATGGPTWAVGTATRTGRSTRR